MDCNILISKLKHNLLLFKGPGRTAQKTLHTYYKNQPVSAVYTNNHSFL